MLTFEYTAKDAKTGEHIKAEVQAESEQVAAKLITKQGLAPLSIKLKGQSTGLLAKFKNRVSTKDRILFSRQLSTLINAGLPLVQSLRTVVEQTDSKQLNLIVGQIISDVEAGNNFSKALSAHPAVFNQVYVSLVAAGESSGTLDAALERIADQQEKDAEILSKVRGAMVYPLIVTLVMVGVVIFMLKGVLPQVGQLYKDLGKELPFMTKIMLGVSDLIGKYWWLMFLVTMLGGFLLKRYHETDEGKKSIDKIKMSLPLFGKLFMKMYMARFCRTATTLVASGVPLLEVLRITAESVNNINIEESTKRAADKVKSGKALSDALADDENFLKLVPQMIKIGERSGAMDKMLEKTAIYYENELDNEIKTISTIIEPALMVMLALMAGIMISAVLLPIYGLVGNTNLK